MNATFHYSQRGHDEAPLLSDNHINRIVEYLVGWKNLALQNNLVTDLKGIDVHAVHDFVPDNALHDVDDAIRNLSDFQVDLSRSDLVDLIGHEAVQRCEQTFSEQYDRIILRHVTAHGRHIDFHTDVSLKTLQIALNDDVEYCGGRLIYLVGENAVIMPRPKGSWTMHRNDIAHGVSRLISGTRQSLFFLRSH